MCHAAGHSPANAASSAPAAAAPPSPAAFTHGMCLARTLSLPCTAAGPLQKCLTKNKDIRKFLDGIYLSERQAELSAGCVIRIFMRGSRAILGRACWPAGSLAYLRAPAPALLQGHPGEGGVGRCLDCPGRALPRAGLSVRSAQRSALRRRASASTSPEAPAPHLGSHTM